MNLVWDRIWSVENPGEALRNQRLKSVLAAGENISAIAGDFFGSPALLQLPCCLNSAINRIEEAGVMMKNIRGHIT